MCGVRQRMRRCKFCLVPRGVTPSARRFYEAIATKCVPVVLSDRFVLPYVASGGGAGLLSAAAVRSFSLHVPEGKPENAPRVVRQAMENHAQMMANLDAHRAAFLYELPADGQPALRMRRTRRHERIGVIEPELQRAVPEAEEGLSKSAPLRREAPVILRVIALHGCIDVRIAQIEHQAVQAAEGAAERRILRQ